MTWEKERNIHPRLPRLTDKSGASGLLWIIRQLQYQTQVFQNLTQVPTIFPTAKDAVLTAYDVTYGKYHGFIIKALFQSAFDAAPEARTILDHMSHATSKYCEDKEDSLTEAMSEEIEDYLSIQDSLHSIRDETVLDEQLLKANHPIENVACIIHKEWLKLKRLLSPCIGNNADQYHSKNLLDTVSMRMVIVNRNAVKITKNPSFTSLTTITQVSDEDIPAHVAVMEQVLQGLEELIKHLNMNDPSKC